MKNKITFFLLLFGISLYGQSPQVPSKLKFGDITLKLSDGARNSIQKDVDLLTKSPKYFEIKAERARTYFPIIEKIFKEEGVPDEFKYLVIQESALVSDAVSSAQAVGFWQLKDFTALELGLRVDRNVDERLNIVSSTYAAARYFKKANGTFDNWLNSLQSYQMGIGGATKVLGYKDSGGKHLTINNNTYWYVKKFLAHMVAFQNISQKPALKPVTIFLHGSGKTISDISRETNKEFEEIKELNKWLLKGKVPVDRPYSVILPGEYSAFQDQITEQSPSKITIQKPLFENVSKSFPKLLDTKYKDHKYIIGVNGLPGIIASSTDNSYTLAKKGEIPHSKFIEYNDLSLKSPQIVPGQVYYFKRKKKKADTHYHTVENGQSLWSVSQQYGIRMDKIISKNRITSASEIKPGRVLWLRFIRPEELPIEYSKIEETSPETEKIQVADINIVESINDSENSEDLTLIKDLKEAPLYNNEEQNQKEIDAETDGSVFYSTTGKVRKLHKVVKGETFYSISTKYNIPVPALLQWNNLEISDTIYIGQELFVFLNKTTNNYLTYKVKSGDTLYKIATDHGVSVDQILKWNERIDYHLKVGEILKINQ